MRVSGLILGFNEAAAYHCGKRAVRSADLLRQRRASMRPQHITAENVSAAAPTSRSSALASMRPQHITAENPAPQGLGAGQRRASMRPQHITAENLFRSAYECTASPLLQ